MRIFLIAIICLLCSASAGLAKQDTYLASEDQFMCVTLEDLNKVNGSLRSGDKTAVIMLVIAEKCFLLEDGDKVRIIGKAGGDVVIVKILSTGEMVFTLRQMLKAL